MRRLITWTLMLAMLAFGPTLALAAKPKGGKPKGGKPKGGKPKATPEKRFSKLDANGDKKLSAEKFAGKKSGEAKGKAEKRFAKLDKDQDKSLSFEEFNVAPKKPKA